MDIADFVERSSQAKSPQDLFCLLVEAARDDGFDQVAYGALTYKEPFQLGDHPQPAIALNYPDQWREHYVRKRYFEIDPVVTLTPYMAGPFRWESLPARYRLDRTQVRLLAEAEEAGLKNGVSVPLHGPCGKVAVVSFASRFDDADPGARLTHLNALALLFHADFANAARTLKDDTPAINLSQRERECLKWTAQGKSSWDIGVILSISENTVNFHVKNAMRKLGTTSRTVAVVKAFRFGLVDLSRL